MELLKYFGWHENPKRYENSQQFFEENKNLMKDCATAQCLDLNKEQSITHLFDDIFSTQTNNIITGTPNPKEILLVSENINTNAKFTLVCRNLYQPITKQVLPYCIGYEETLPVYFFGKNPDSSWKSLCLREENPGYSFSETDSALKINALSTLLFSAVAIGIFCCIYAVTKHWADESQNEKPQTIAPNTGCVEKFGLPEEPSQDVVSGPIINIEHEIQQIENLKIREVLHSFPSEKKNHSQMKQLLNFIQALQKESLQQAKTEETSHIKFLSIFSSFPREIQKSSSMNELVSLLETNFPTFAQNLNVRYPELRSSFTESYRNFQRFWRTQ